MAKHFRTEVASKPENSVLSRKFRTFLRWMRDNGIEYSDALTFELGGSGSVADIGVRALVDMKEGDLIATIPKQACLTMLNTAAFAVLEEAEIGGGLGLAVALMYEMSLQERSKWYGYLQLLPKEQKLPFLWTLEEIDELLAGTELHQVIKEDRVLMEEDWKDSIAPLTEFNPDIFPAEWFTLDRYLAAKTLVNSRAFEVDDYHGYGMVPLADLFNHKTADEDVHFTNVSSESEADSEESEDEERPPSPPVRKNGRKHAHLEKDDEEKSRKVCKPTKARKKRSKDGGHADIEDHQTGVVIKREEPVKTRQSKRGKSKRLKEEVNPDILVQEAGEFPRAEVAMKLREKKAQLLKSEGDRELKDVEKPKSRQKAKAKKNSADMVKHDSESEVKDKSKTQQIAKKKGSDRMEMEVQVQESTKVEETRKRRGKRKQVEMRENDVDHETDHQTQQQGNRQRSRKQNQVAESWTQRSDKVEGSSDLSSQAGERKSGILEMILVKNVAGASEVFNTYGTLSNAGLLHRYGFTELNNPFDIVNIDLSLVEDSVGHAYTSRHVRRRVTTWRKFCCCPLDSQDSLYFEISATGKAEVGLPMLIYMVHLSDERFDTLSQMSAGSDSVSRIESTAMFLGWEGSLEHQPVAKKGRRKSKGHGKEFEKENRPKVDLETWLLTAPVCKSMLEILKLRDGLYSTDSIEDDEAMLIATDRSRQPEAFHACSLRISERSILKRCETHVTRQLNLLTECT